MHRPTRLDELYEEREQIAHEAEANARAIEVEEAREQQRIREREAARA